MPFLKPGFDAVPTPLVAYDHAGKVVAANAAAGDVLGAQPEDLVGSDAYRSGWLVTDAAGWPEAENLHPALAAIRHRAAHSAVVRVGRPLFMHPKVERHAKTGR